MKLCDYGCGREAKYPPRKGMRRWCCSEDFRVCPGIRKKISIKVKGIHKDPNGVYNSKSCKEKHSIAIKEIHKDPNSKYKSTLCNEKRSKGMKKIWEDPNSIFNSNEYRENRSNNMKKLHKDPNSNYYSNSYKNKQKLNIEYINKKYPFFSKIEEMKYNPDKLGEQEIQVRCKNHECENSKEKDGWFTPTNTQLKERIRQLENKNGSGGCYFYCSQYCKDTCPLYYLKDDPYKDNDKPYTYEEYQTCRTVVMERENGLCEYCGEPATDMHHIFPVKLEPFFALDPDYCVACCEKHHYEYGHKDECSTGNLAKIVCSVESQKFLNQKIGDA